jgi:hypothetical protein
MRYVRSLQISPLLNLFHKLEFLGSLRQCFLFHILGVIYSLFTRFLFQLGHIKYFERVLKSPGK